MRLNNIAQTARIRQFYITPYRSGNLAFSVGDLSGTFNEVSYQMFNRNTKAEYGKILNEAQVITYKTKLQGREVIGSYQNKHFGWANRYVENEANQIDVELGTIRGVNI